MRRPRSRTSWCTSRHTTLTSDAIDDGPRPTTGCAPPKHTQIGHRKLKHIAMSEYLYGKLPTYSVAMNECGKLPARSCLLVGVGLAICWGRVQTRVIRRSAIRLLFLHNKGKGRLGSMILSQMSESFRAIPAELIRRCHVLKGVEKG